MNTNETFKQLILSYSKSQRIGIIFLFVLIFICQGIYFFKNFNSVENAPKEKAQWLSYQKEIDSLKILKSDFKPTIYPFNPNFITDFKGYKLGMSVAEIDRLLAFRKQNKFVNSAEEFQQVTKVSDSLLKKLRTTDDKDASSNISKTELKAFLEALERVLKMKEGEKNGK